MGPAAQVSSVREHQQSASGPLQEHLAARRHPGEQVRETAFILYHNIWSQPESHSHTH